ncbi:MAG: beta-ketoacyl-ACP synthase III [Clostridia bacterium]
MKKINIIETSSYLPEKIITNEYMESIVETSDEWITTRTGIKTRRFAENQSNADMATQVAKQLIEKGKIAKEEIGALIVATFTPDNFTPSVACVVHKNLELLEDVLTFDFNAACSGFVYGLQIAKGLLLQNPTKKAIVIGSEKISQHLNFEDRNTCILFGDGAGGVIMDLCDGEQDDEFLFGCRGNDTTILCSAKDNHKLYMDGGEVFTFAVNTVVNCITNMLEKTKLTGDDIDYIVCHQANERIIARAYKKLSLDAKKFFVNLDKYGNTSSASIPIALDEMNKQGLLKKNDKVMCIGFGSGLAYGATLLTW